MDLQMPEMDGFQAATEIQAHGRRRGLRLPILAMTANALPDDRQRCRDAGMTGYLAKPVRAWQLHQAIRDTLDGVDSAGSTLPNQGMAEADHDAGIDWDEARAAVGGDSPLLSSMVEAALKETASQWKSICEAMDNRDPAAVRIAAHTIKGAIRYFGETPAFVEAYRIEQMARDDPSDLSDHSLDALGRALEKVRGELTQYLETRSQESIAD
jgi:CheY-like chemotaxis protein